MGASVKQILKGKSSGTLTIGPDQTAEAAMQVMVERSIGALPVVNGEKLIGIISERDFLRRVLAKGDSLDSVRVREIMTGEPRTVNSNDDIGHCMELMTGLRIRHLPVVDGGRLVGLLSIGDVVRATMEEQQATIEQLEMYIRS